MTRRVTKTTVRGLLSKGLTGREAGRLLLQHVIDEYYGKPSLLNDADIAVIKNAPMKNHEIAHYNSLVNVCQAFHRALPAIQLACKDACLHMIYLVEPLRDIDRRRTVELFASTGPHIVTRRQYDDIVAAQRKTKLNHEYSLDEVFEERFYAMASPETRREIEELGFDTDSTDAFLAAVPKKYSRLCGRAIKQIRDLLIPGVLEAKPLSHYQCCNLLTKADLCDPPDTSHVYHMTHVCQDLMYKVMYISSPQPS